MPKWTIEEAREHYNINGWGAGYFDINSKGNIVVRSNRKSHHDIDLKELVDDIQAKGYSLPVLIRFSDILKASIANLANSFSKAISEYGYNGQYHGVYPIKVNQQRQVVEEIVKFGQPYNIGLEAGSKPELHAILAILDNPEALLVCNGYKDEAFIRLALMSQKLGKKVFIVVEKLDGTGEILSNIVSSQVEEHKEFGGIVPELAARSHVEKIDLIIKRCIFLYLNQEKQQIPMQH